MTTRTDKEILAGQKQADTERQAEWELIQKKFPIIPSDPPEKQDAMRIAQNVAMLDP